MCLGRGGFLLNDLPDQDSTSATHGGLDALENTNAIVVGPIVNDVSQPIHIGLFDGVILEKVMLNELYTAAMQGTGILSWPDLGLR